MKYIINLSIVFDIDTRALMLKNDSHLSIELSKPATRLLCELITHNNITLIREDIIRTVWVDYGFTPSVASLSNHISELRKAFESLGLNKEIIITVPRIGFRMEADIHPVVASEDTFSETEAEALEVVNPGKAFSELNNHVVVKSETLSGMKKHQIDAKSSIVIVSIILASVAAVFYFIMPPKNKVTHAIFTKEKCNIYNANEKNPAEDFITNVSKMMSSEGIDCKREVVDIYYTEARPAKKLNIKFMAVCYSGGSSSYHKCINYKNIR